MKQKTSGKLIITSYTYERNHNKSCTHAVACFIANNQLEYVKVIPDIDTIPAGTILTGKVKNVVSNIPAAFVGIKEDGAMGFLSMNNLHQAVLTNGTFRGNLKSGDEILVQVVREPMKTKEATLTAQICMHGTYAAAQPGSGRLLFSKKLSAKVKDRILEYLVSKAVVTREKQLIGLSDMDITVRTAAGELCGSSGMESPNKALDALVTDIEDAALSLKQLIEKASMRTCYTIHQKSVTWLEEVRSELRACDFMIEEYVTDDFEMKKKLLELVQEQEKTRIRLYQDDTISLSSLYGIPSRLDQLRSNRVWLKSGGYLYIEPTEAMVVIDVNSGKAMQKTNNEQLYFDINMEAAKEVSRQLRLRNLSGIVIVDFINLKDKEKEEELLLYVKDCCKCDFSKVTVYEFTRLGLLEMTRNKKSKALHEIL